MTKKEKDKKDRQWSTKLDNWLLSVLVHAREMLMGSVCHLFGTGCTHLLWTLKCRLDQRIKGDYKWNSVNSV